MAMIIVLSYDQCLCQELEPRTYANLPKGMSAIAVAYSFSYGNVLTDPTMPIEGFKATGHGLNAGYFHTFALAGQLARIQLSLPFIHNSAKLKLNGRDTSGARTGFGDIRIRFGINLLGSPALAKAEFAKYQQKMIVGFGLVTSVPTGLYHKEKRINIGSNRWGFKPEIAISKRFTRIYAEAYGGVWLFTQNREYLVTKKSKQQPIYSFQAHVSYYFPNRMWIGVDGNWFTGGQILVNGALTIPVKNNWRIGGIWSIPLKTNHSFKLQFHIAAVTNRGYDYNVIAFGYQYIFEDKEARNGRKGN